MSTETITQDELKAVIHYNPNTGVMNWLGARKKCGWVCPVRGYLHIQINGRGYRQHRLAFLYMTGRYPEQIDHKNHMVCDNRWINLREASQAVNNKNASRRRDNTSGITGVMRGKPDTHSWRARIHVAGRDKRLGMFVDFFEACCARKSAELKYGFHENHGR